MFAKTPEYLTVAGVGLTLAGLGFVMSRLDTQRPAPPVTTIPALPPSTMVAPPPPPPASEPAPPPEEPPGPTEPIAANLYQGGGNPSPSEPSPSEPSPTEASDRKLSEQTPDGNTEPAAAPSLADAPKEVRDPVADPARATAAANDRAHGEVVDEGIAAPSYAIDNLERSLPDLVASGQAVVAVQADDGSLFYSTDLERFQLAASSRNLAGFNLHRTLPLGGRRWVAACAEDFPGMDRSRASARVYFSHDADTRILRAQCEAAAAKGLPLERLAETSGSLTIRGGAVAYLVASVTTKPAAPNPNPEPSPQ